LLGTLLRLPLLLPRLLLGTLLRLPLLLLRLLLGTLLRLPLLLLRLLLGPLLRLSLLLLLLLLLRVPSVFCVLLLLSVRGTNSAEKHEQNSCPDKTNWFHELYLHHRNRMRLSAYRQMNPEPATPGINGLFSHQLSL
jgi:hypothetical protein